MAKYMFQKELENVMGQTHETELAGRDELQSKPKGCQAETEEGCCYAFCCRSRSEEGEEGKE